MGLCISKPVFGYSESTTGALERVEIPNPTAHDKKRVAEQKAFFLQKVGEENMQALKRGDTLCTSGAPDYRPRAIIRKPPPLGR